MKKAGTRRIPALLLLLLCVGAFLGVGRNGFVTLDDGLYLIDNPMVTQGLSAEGVRWAFTTGHTGNWHPLTWLSHMLDVGIFGMVAGRHHLMSLALHAGSALLLFSVLNSLTGARWRSFFAAALFSIHPLRVESVAWASERKDVLAMFFTLLALRSYLGWLRRPAARKRRMALVSFFTLALLAKPMPVSFPFLLLLVDWWPLGRWTPRLDAAPGLWRGIRASLPPRTLWREKAPLFLLAVLSGVITSIAQTTFGAVLPTWYISLPARLANAAQSYVSYLATTIWPRDLAVFYPHPNAIPPWPTWSASLLALTAVTVLVWRSRKRFPWLPVGWLWYLGALIPMIGLVQVGMQARADRYTYLPHIGLLILVVWGLAEGCGRSKARLAAPIAGIAAVLTLAAVTIVQIPSWQSGVALFTRALEVASRNRRGFMSPKSPALAFIHNGLGEAYMDEGRLDEAIVQLRRAIAYNPEFPAPTYNLGLALLNSGQAVEAVPFLRAALRLKPNHPLCLYNLGAALHQTDSRTEAEDCYRRALVADPDFLDARYNLGTILLRGNRPNEALAEFELVLARQPDHAGARNNRGLILLRRHDLPRARADFETAVRIEPSNDKAWQNLAVTFEKMNRLAEAEASYSRALALKPKKPDATLGLERVRALRGKQ